MTVGWRRPQTLLMQAAGTLLLAFSDRMAPLALGCMLFGLGAAPRRCHPP